MKIARKLTKRLVQLENANQLFQLDMRYSEKQVNEVLAEIFDDHVFARRLLIEWGFLDRERDGSSYWRLK
ncbi:MAG: DUF2087 domain-containing protein [Micrococcales bacterium]|nr:DUF2087 domain-containing protein [Micrococcales bacterium]NBT47092.1 DUF2087 domain-containing protein [Actinomycetota bacterium]NBY44181.1 DUF2087 domain-containing protein [Micrococcales bacterium]NDE88451.1 DUF2087 domain-containing protein [Micrococcales bacterium]